MTFRAAATGNNGTTATATSTCTYTVPASVQAGDIMLVYVQANTATLTTTIAGGGTSVAWATLSGRDNNSSPIGSYLFVGTADAGSAGSTITVTWSGSARTDGVMSCFSNVQTPTDFQLAVSTAAATTLTFPAVTTTGNGDDICLIGGYRAAVTTAPSLTAPTGYTKDSESLSAYSTSPEYCASVSHINNLPNAGTVTPPGSTVSQSSTSNLYTVALPPASLNKLKLGTGSVSLAVGASAASKAYLGNTQVWP